jgi:hypothetical protein
MNAKQAKRLRKFAQQTTIGADERGYLLPNLGGNKTGTPMFSADGRLIGYTSAPIQLDRTTTRGLYQALKKELR